MKNRFTAKKKSKRKSQLVAWIRPGQFRHVTIDMDRFLKQLAECKQEWTYPDGEEMYDNFRSWQHVHFRLEQEFRRMARAFEDMYDDDEWDTMQLKPWHDVQIRSNIKMLRWAWGRVMKWRKRMHQAWWEVMKQPVTVKGGKQISLKDDLLNRLYAAVWTKRGGHETLDNLLCDALFLLGSRRRALNDIQAALTELKVDSI